MNFLITGGGGFLGRHLVTQLIENDHSVKIIDLKIPEKELYQRPPVTCVRADVKNQNIMKNLCRNVDVIVHAAAALPIENPNTIQKTIIEGTRVALESAVKTGVDRFVFISSTAVYGIHDSKKPLRENSSKKPKGAYGKAKYKAEKLCREYRDEIFVSILRPKTFVGPERLGIMGVIFDWIRRGKNIYLPGDGTNCYQLLDVQDLCDAILIASNHPDADDTFNVGAREYGTLNEDLKPVLNRLNNDSRLIHVPAKPVQLVLRFLEMVKLSPLVRWQYETVDKNFCVDTSKIRNTFKWEPTYSNRNAIMRNFEWYLDNYEKFQEESGVTHWVPWDQKILKILRFFS